MKKREGDGAMDTKTTVADVLGSGSWRPFVAMDPEWVARNFGLTCDYMDEELRRETSLWKTGGEDATLWTPGIRVWDTYGGREEMFAWGERSTFEAWCTADERFLEYEEDMDALDGALERYRAACLHTGGGGFTPREAAKWRERLDVRLVGAGTSGERMEPVGRGEVARWGRGVQDIARALRRTLEGEGWRLAYRDEAGQEVECAERTARNATPVLEVRVEGREG